MDVDFEYPLIPATIASSTSNADWRRYPRPERPGVYLLNFMPSQVHCKYPTMHTTCIVIMKQRTIIHHHSRNVSEGLCTMRIRPNDTHGWLVAQQPETSTILTYVWERHAFPWLVTWEEQRCRKGTLPSLPFTSIERVAGRTSMVGSNINARP